DRRAQRRCPGDLPRPTSDPHAIALQWQRRAVWRTDRRNLSATHRTRLVRTGWHPMKSLALLTVLCSIALLPGCATIHFDNGEALPLPDTAFSSMKYWFSDEAPPERRSLPPESSMYHHGILSLIEISNALELDFICTGY